MSKISKKRIKENIFGAQICWGASLLIFVGAAIIALFHPGEELFSAFGYLGVAMIMVSGINLYVYIKECRILKGAHWILADGLCTFLLSLFPIFRQMVQPELIPFFFGMWELFSGVLKAVESIELRGWKLREWKGFFYVGAIEILSGVASLLEPVDDFMGIHRVVAMIFIVQCFGFVFKILVYSKINEKNLIS